jgi:hypothetical protein
MVVVGFPLYRRVIATRALAIVGSLNLDSHIVLGVGLVEMTLGEPVRRARRERIHVEGIVASVTIFIRVGLVTSIASLGTITGRVIRC